MRRRKLKNKTAVYIDDVKCFKCNCTNETLYKVSDGKYVCRTCALKEVRKLGLLERGNLTRKIKEIKA